MKSLWSALVLSACVAAPAVAEVSDPIEPVNRGIFWFNDQADIYVVEPTAQGWNYILPEAMQTAVGNFFDNVRFPVVMINNLLQGKVVDASSDVGRFLVNTTIGVLGFFDPATGYGLVRHDEDFGQTLGYWGVPPGPYLVAPLFGPTNIRDGVGRIADTFTAVYPVFAAIQYTVGATTVSTLNFRSQVLDEVDSAKEASLDYYVFVRNAYEQRRQALIDDRDAVSTEVEEDLYFGEFDEDQGETE